MIKSFLSKQLQIFFLENKSSQASLLGRCNSVAGTPTNRKPAEDQKINFFVDTSKGQQIRMPIY
jgi:hypothetical protein